MPPTWRSSWPRSPGTSSPRRRRLTAARRQRLGRTTRPHFARKWSGMRTHSGRAPLLGSPPKAESRAARRSWAEGAGDPGCWGESVRVAPPFGASPSANPVSTRRGTCSARAGASARPGVGTLYPGGRSSIARPSASSAPATIAERADYAARPRRAAPAPAPTAPASAGRGRRAAANGAAPSTITGPAPSATCPSPRRPRAHASAGTNARAFKPDRTAMWAVLLGLLLIRGRHERPAGALAKSPPLQSRRAPAAADPVFMGPPVRI